MFEAEKAMELADNMGYPVIIKASSGGGGKGMRVAESHEDFLINFETAQRESVAAFGDNTMYLEKYIQSPRHIEFQILADKYGNVVHLGERDCSIQRNHQKVIEESPSMAIDDKLRKKMGDVAVKAAKAAHYENAGTIEFLLDKNGEFYFMEMNTRIQVEHPVTEMVTGLDLVKEQIRIASGEKLSCHQKDIKVQGHAIECRINAEDPSKKFRPSPGMIKNIHFPGGNGVRIDSSIPPNYDSMICKVIVHDKDRTSAINKMQSVLGELVIEGVKTNIDFQFDIISNERFRKGEINTHFIKDVYGL